jgi:hypothetical protein
VQSVAKYFYLSSLNCYYSCTFSVIFFFFALMRAISSEFPLLLSTVCSLLSTSPTSSLSCLSYLNIFLLYSLFANHNFFLVNPLLFRIENKK